MKMVREPFEEQAESKGYQSMTKEAEKYAESTACSNSLIILTQSVLSRKGKLYPGIS